jgi:hypothetical protein
MKIEQQFARESCQQTADMESLGIPDLTGLRHRLLPEANKPKVEGRNVRIPKSIHPDSNKR